MAPPLLSPGEVARALAALPGFRSVDGALVCRYRFANFAAAVGFTNEVAKVAEQFDHHPDWTVSFRRVEVRTTTHDAGGVTRLDVDLAQRVAALAQTAGAEVWSGDAGSADPAAGD